MQWSRSDVVTIHPSFRRTVTLEGISNHLDDSFRDHLEGWFTGGERSKQLRGVDHAIDRTGICFSAHVHAMRRQQIWGLCVALQQVEKHIRVLARQYHVAVGAPSVVYLCLANNEAVANVYFQIHH